MLFHFLRSMGTFCLLLYGIAAFAQPFSPGTSYFGNEQYIEYLAGNMPIILSAPHGGLLNPSSLPDRSCSGCSTVNDFNTQELARALASSIHEQTGCWPHLVINRLHRRKLDANRDLEEAADGHPVAGQAWADFHAFLGIAKEQVSNQFGKGLYIDLHGHGHAVQRLELGYLLYEEELRLPDDTLNLSNYIGYSSIQHLVGNNLQGLSHAELLRGNQSMGTLLANRGYPATPSLSDPAPALGQAYFSGGYNTATYSSYQGGVIDGFQLECNRTGIRDSITQVQRFADTLAVSILDYLGRHYFSESMSSYCNSSVATEFTPEDLWSIQPNPFCEELTLKTDVIGKEWELEGYSFTGQLLFQQSLGETNLIRLSSSILPGGWLVLRCKGEIRSVKTVIRKCE